MASHGPRGIAWLVLVCLVPTVAAHDLATPWAEYGGGHARLHAGLNEGPSTGTVLWSKTFQGADSGSPVIADGAVYFGYQTTGGQGWLHAFSLDDGTERWKVRLNNSIATTPLVDGSIVYAVGIDLHGSVSALSAVDGSQIWRYDHAQHITTSPVLDGNRIYVVDGRGTLLALSRSTGALAWSASLEPGVAAGPGGSAFAVEEGHAFVGTASGPFCNKPCSNDYVYAMDLASHDRAWRVDPSDPQSTDDDVRSVPAVIGGRLFLALPHVGDFYDDPQAETGYHPAIPGKLVALDADDGGLVWDLETPTSSFSNAAVMDGTVYAANSDGDVYALDASEGSLLWQRPVDDGLSTPVSIARDVLFVGGVEKTTCIHAASGTTYQGLEAGFLHALQRSNGAVIRSSQLAGDPDGSLAVAEGRVAVKSRGISPATCLHDENLHLQVLGAVPAAHGANAAPQASAFEPADGSSTSASSTTFRWSGSDANAGDALRYDVHFGTTNPPPLVRNLQAADEFDPGPLPSGPTYYWRIATYDSHGARVEGPVLSFETTGSVPTTTTRVTTTSATSTGAGTFPTPDDQNGAPSPGAWLILAAAALALTLVRRRGRLR